MKKKVVFADKQNPFIVSIATNNDRWRLGEKTFMNRLLRDQKK